MRKLLITGISGGQGRLVAKCLRPSWQVAGVDRTGWPAAPEGVEVHVADLRKKRVDNVFRRVKPDAVVHLAFVRHFRSDPAVRHQVNVEGTRRLLENCVEHKVKQLVVLSSHYVYGALPDNPMYVEEDHPLNASRNFPEIRDLCEVEGIVGTFLWRYPEIATSILRPVNTLGRYVHSAIGSYLRRETLPRVAGFDPMMQFVHEVDVARAIEQALEHQLRGVFNVAGPGAIPLSAAIEALGRGSIPLLDPFAHFLIRQLFRWNVYSFPAGAIDFLKYPCTVSDARFREATGFEPEHTLRATLASVDG